MYELLGPDGAGKMTIIRVLATLLRPDAGTATVLGHVVVKEPAAVREKVSVTGQYASIDEGLTGRENLVLGGHLLEFGWRDARERDDDLLAAFGLAVINHGRVIAEGTSRVRRPRSARARSTSACKTLHGAQRPRPF